MTATAESRRTSPRLVQ